MIRIQLRYIPNLITCLRLVLIVPILLTLLKKHYSLAFALLLIAGLSDGLDGLLARFYGWTSALGALLDPIADKLLLMGSFVVLAYLQQIPIGLAACVVGRDIWIMGGALAYRCWVGPLAYKPVWISKLNTFLQLILVTLLVIQLAFLALPDGVIWLLSELVFITVLSSFACYTWSWARQAAFYLRMAERNQKQELS